MRLRFQNKRQRGAVALEFLLLFPFIVATLYAAASYSVLFFNQYRMQDAVTQAANLSLSIDRSSYNADQLKGVVETRSSQALNALIGSLPASFRGAVQPDLTGCAVGTVSDVEMLRCSVGVAGGDSGLLPLISFGWLGQFPPMPSSLQAEASVAF
ncbi:TadE/TadG family type IV pilus assembly protein [Marinobacter mangrovi]|uniref:TadE/TadG family type IV pilus assembly protein n=1 Tax=Marinobacter mangrovi TaxID=2803918 RepID=UPI001931E144|nr:TadE/TadG family type IV pilus assembly protein [Marinobacter mangrovi]